MLLLLWQNCALTVTLSRGTGVFSWDGEHPGYSRSIPSRIFVSGLPPGPAPCGALENALFFTQTVEQMTRLPPPLLGTMDKIVASSEMKVDTKMFINTPPSSSNHQVLRTNSKKSRRCSHHRSRNSSFCSDNNSGSAAQTQRRGMMLNIHKYFAIVAASLLSLLSVGVVHPSSTSGSILFVNAQQTAQQQQQQGGGGGGGGGASTSQGKPSKSEAIHPPAGLFEKLDSNHDSMLSIDEYTIGWPLIADEFPSSGGGGGISSFFLPKYKGGFWKAFTSGVAMILATEIGDKTFFIAAVLSMRQQRSAVFIGAVLSLYVMTVLSSIMGLGTCASQSNSNRI